MTTHQDRSIFARTADGRIVSFRLLTVLLAASLGCTVYLIVVLSMTVGSDAAGVALPASTAPRADDDDHRREFDFWLGSWDVLNKRLQPDGTWRDTSTAKARIQSILGREAVLEQWIGQGGNPLRGFSLRAYDPDLGKWVVILNWTGGRPSQFNRMHGIADGKFVDLTPPGAVDSGARQYPRFRFEDQGPDDVQWSMANTTDGGETWRTTWIMEFSRTGPPIETDASNAPITPVPDDTYCPKPRARELDLLIGAWRGDVRRKQPDGTWREGELVMRTTSMIAGCGLQLFMDFHWDDDEITRNFMALAYDMGRRHWVFETIAEGAPGFVTYAGDFDDQANTLALTSMGPDPERTMTWTNLGDSSFRLELARGTETTLIVEAERPPMPSR